MARNKKAKPTSQAAQEAARWLARLQSNTCEAEREEFAEWLAAGRANISEFLAVSVVDEQLLAISRSTDIDLEALEAAHIAGDHIISIDGTGNAALADNDVGQRNTGHIRRKWLVAGVGIAAALLLSLSPAFIITDAPRSVPVAERAMAREYVTSVGEQRSVVLADGSILRLSASTKISVDYSDEARNLRLHTGEADFTVAHDSNRPFFVDAAGTIVRAVGTRFNINLLQSGTEIAVLEGKVRVVNAARLKTDSMGAVDRPARSSDEMLGEAIPSFDIDAGELLRLTGGGAPVKSRPVDIEQQVSWQGRRLSFQEASLQDIAEQFNRYNKRKITISYGTTNDVRFSGTFETGDPDSFIAYIKTVEDLHVSTNGDGFRVSALK